MPALRSQTAPSASNDANDAAGHCAASRPPYRRIVVKAGTSVLTGGDSQGNLDTAVMADLVAQISRLVNGHPTQALLVTSGAIAAGRQALAETAAVPAIPDIPTRQVLAALGQSRLMNIYADRFARHGVAISQVLLTLHDLAHRQSYLDIRNTLLSLLDLGIVPVVNENDVVASDEIGEIFGDNDRLSALIAALIDADLLVILTDVDGLYTANPNTDPTATRIATVAVVDDDVLAMAGEHRNAWARGGMPTKLHAAHLVTTLRNRHDHLPGPRPRCSAAGRPGRTRGHLFPACRQQARSPQAVDAQPRRRQRLGPGGGGRWRGVGAAPQRGQPAPHRRSQRCWRFPRRGDIIYISDFARHHIACGIANYSAADVQRIQGLRSDVSPTPLATTTGRKSCIATTWSCSRRRQVTNPGHPVP